MAEMGTMAGAMAANATANTTDQPTGLGWAGAHNHTLHRNGSLALHEPTPEELRHSVIVFYIVLVVIFGAQGGLVLWRKRHKRSYELATLLGLWLIPAIVCFQMSFWRFLAVHAIYTAVTGYYLVRCCVGALDKDLPHQVYRWFSWVFHCSFALGCAGYFLLLLEALTLGPFLQAIFPPLLCLTVLWYGLYFGILTRDAAEVASDRIAQGLGGRRRLAVSVRSCGICGGDLQDGPTGPAPTAGPGRASVQLSCRHLFHSDCIRGWTIIGKKDTCPTCREKVDLRQLYKARPWETTNVSWTQMLDFVRFFVVWNPIILVGLHFIFHWTGLEMEQPDSDGAALLANATLPASSPVVPSW